jgi:crotonobetainyl-CoA:carnitine CoA-transferase CaiB-like acyl-CoA transferase
MLTGVRILDLTSLFPGPLATRLLVDLGATVIKVERPAGDPMRAAHPAVDGSSAQFRALNGGKQSILIDLKRPGGAELIREIAATVEVVVESFRPGVADRLGVGYNTLRRGHQSLVYTSLTGYGPDHALAAHAAHDINAIARSGLAAAGAGANGVPRHTGALVADASLAALAAASMLAALHRATATGVGCRLELSLLDSALWVGGLHLAAAAAGTPVLPGRQTTDGAHAGYGYYACADGAWVAVGALEPHLWATLVSALGIPIADPRTAHPKVAAAFATRSRAQWLAELTPLDVCVSPVLNHQQVLAESPEIHAPVVVDGARPGPTGPAPALGADTLAVLRSAGLSDHEIGAAAQRGLLPPAGESR